MPNNYHLPAAFAGFAGLMMSASAVTRELPTPAESLTRDTESSTNCVLSGWTDLTQRFVFTVKTEPAPDKAVIVALGTDEDDDGDLSFEEVATRFGTDCGRAFSTTSNYNSSVTYTFDLSSVFDRSWNLAKVTTYGNPSKVEVTAQFKNNPFVFILK